MMTDDDLQALIDYLAQRLAPPADARARAVDAPLSWGMLAALAEALTALRELAEWRRGHEWHD